MLRPNARRARAARLVFLLLAVASGLLLLALLLPGGASPDDAGLPAATTLLYASFGLLSLLHVALVIGSYVALILWLRRAYWNLHHLPGTRLRPDYSDGWAAGAWFVPFLNLVRPYTIVREVWRLTQLAALDREAEPPTVLGWWWAAYLGKLLIGRVFYALNHGSVSVGVGAQAGGGALEAGAQLVSALLFWYVIGRIAHFEEQLVLRQQVAQLGQPAPALAAGPAADQSDYSRSEEY